MKRHSILTGLSLAFASLCMPQISGAVVDAGQLPGYSVATSGAMINATPGAFDLASGGHGGNGGSGHSGGSDDSGHHGGSDDSGHHGGSSDDDDDDSSGSGRPDPRVPGGSGCDSASDVQEHSSCSA